MKHYFIILVLVFSICLLVNFNLPSFSDFPEGLFFVSNVSCLFFPVIYDEFWAEEHFWILIELCLVALLAKTLAVPRPSGRSKRRSKNRRKNRTSRKGGHRSKPLSLNKLRRRLQAVLEAEMAQQQTTTQRKPPSTMDELTLSEVHSLYDLLDERRCVELFKKHRWKDGKVVCPSCNSDKTHVFDHNYKKFWRRHVCEKCGKTFTDKTGTIFDKTHLPIKYWFAAIEFLQDGKSAEHIADALNINHNSGERLVKLLLTAGYLDRAKSPLSNISEADEVYITSGLKGNPKGTKRDRPPRKRGLKKRGRGTFETDKVPVVAIVQRDGEVRLLVLKNVQTPTIKPYFQQLLQKDSSIFTDAYVIYGFLTKEGFDHRSVNHSAGEYARGEVHCNTAEGLFSLLRHFIRNYRGVSKIYLPLYVAAFEFDYNHRHLTAWQKNMVFLDSVLNADGEKIKKKFQNRSLAQLCQIEEQINHFT